MPTKTSLKPGWLSETLQEAHIESMASRNKSFYKHLGHTIKVYDGDAQALYDKLDARFKSWTGFTLKEFVNVQD